MTTCAATSRLQFIHQRLACLHPAAAVVASSATMTHFSRPIHAATVQSTTKPMPNQQPHNQPSRPLRTRTNTEHTSPPPTSTEPSPTPIPQSLSSITAPPLPSPPSPPSYNNEPPASVRDALLSCDAICFDVDSTVLTEEGIDVLASHLGKGSQVAALTSAAMNGGLSFHTALQQRLDLLQPSRQDIEACLAAHPLTLTPGFLSLLHLLRCQGKRVYLVTGGFSHMIAHLLPRLRIPPSRVYANQLLFSEPSGRYEGFDATQPTSQSGGKAAAITAILSGTDSGSGSRLSSVVMVGDGMTDVEARPPAVCMVGYGGVVVREAVRAKADWFVLDWRQLMDVFESEEERRTREERMRREEEAEQGGAEEVKQREEREEKSSVQEVKQEPPSTPTATSTAALVTLASEVVDGTPPKKQRRPRSDKGVKRARPSKSAEKQEKPAEQVPTVAQQRMSKQMRSEEQGRRREEAAKASSEIDATMAEWTALPMLKQGKVVFSRVGSEEQIPPL